MAEIYLARTTGSDGSGSLVAVKRMLPALSKDDDYVGMFLDEARIAARLTHPNIVRVLDFGVDGEARFFAMEYLNGLDVKQIVKTLFWKPLRMPLEQGISIVLGACRGLHYAHEKASNDGAALNLVHRDVSPDNLVVTYDGVVKVIDFGVAKSTRQSKKTRHGMLKGKISYMSPEQCKGASIDRRSDVFSLAIILWELTTGRRLFHLGRYYDTLEAIVRKDAPRPSRLDSGYPQELERIVMKGLCRNPRRRYQSAQHLAVDLEKFACEQMLDISAFRLGRFMRETYGPRSPESIARPLETQPPARQLPNDITRRLQVHSVLTDGPRRGHPPTPPASCADDLPRHRRSHVHRLEATAGEKSLRSCSRTSNAPHIFETLRSLVGGLRFAVYLFMRTVSTLILTLGLVFSPVVSARKVRHPRSSRHRLAPRSTLEYQKAEAQLEELRNAKELPVDPTDELDFPGQQSKDSEIPPGLKRK